MTDWTSDPRSRCGDDEHDSVNHRGDPDNGRKGDTLVLFSRRLDWTDVVRERTPGRTPGGLHNRGSGAPATLSMPLIRARERFGGC